MLCVTDLPEKEIILPTFVESNHRHLHHLDSTGKNITDRIICVLGFVCPDITYSPVIYSLTSLLLHFMPGLNLTEQFYKINIIDKIFSFNIF